MGEFLQGKISVKHYLNKKLNPKMIRGKESFPLYVRIGFQNKVTELKSNLNDYQPHGSVDELINDFHIDDGIENYFTELQFNSMLKSDARLIAEQEAIVGIVDILRSQGTNILTLDAPRIISALSTRLDRAIIAQLKVRLKDEILVNESNPYIALRQVINWELSYYRILSALKSISKDEKCSTVFYTKVLKWFDNLSISSLNSIGLENKSRVRIYHWGNAEFRKKLKKELQNTNSSSSVAALISIIEQIYNENISKINLG